MDDSIVRDFRKTFASIKDKKIALYGTGRIARLLLDNCKDFHIEGVLDNNAIESSFCGKPIIPVEQIGFYGLDSIIIVARKSSAMIIRNRIADTCGKFHIHLYDLHGNDPGVFYKNCSAADIYQFDGGRSNKLVIKLFSDAYSVWKDSKNARQFGYTFAAPVITSFCISLFRYIEANRYDSVWLLSRDGYLIKKCLEMLKSRFGSESELLYLMTSRKALADGANQQNYVRYLRKKQGNRKKILIVDFVAAGTCQERLEALLDRRFDGYYFVRIYNEDKAGLNVSSFYSVSEYGNDTSALYTLYPLLEVLVSSTEPSFAGFDDHGEKVYCDDLISSDIADNIAQAQEGMIDYFRTYIRGTGCFDTLPDFELCDAILQIGSKEDLEDIPFLNYKYYDEFYRREYHLPLPVELL